MPSSAQEDEELCRCGAMLRGGAADHATGVAGGRRLAPHPVPHPIYREDSEQRCAHVRVFFHGQRVSIRLQAILPTIRVTRTHPAVHIFL